LDLQGLGKEIDNRSFKVDAREMSPMHAATIPSLHSRRALERCRLLVAKPAVHISILVLVTLWLGCKDIRVGDFRNPDAWSHAMNGVYLLDLIKQMPIHGFWDFTVRYYAKYPAISLPYHPPGFPLIEMVFFAVFGISPATARFAVVLCAIIGIIAWYGLVQSTHNRNLAFLSSLLIVANNTVVVFSRQVMLEVPTLAVSILSLYCLHRAIESNSRSYLYCWALSAGASVWFKQSALFILPLSLTYLFFKRKHYKLASRDLFFSWGIVIVGITPIAFTTWYFARFAYEQVVMSTRLYGFEKASLANWLYYLRFFPHQVPVPVLIVAAISIAMLIWKRRWERHLIYFLWLVWGYVIISYISVKDTRYAFFLIPPVYLFACSIVDEIKIKLRGIRVATVLLGCACITQCAFACRVPTRIIVGFEQAARYVVDNWKGNTVIVCARYHGNFTFNVRRLDPSGKIMVLRAEKVMPELRFRREQRNEEYLFSALRSLGTKYIVVENLDWEDIPELARLRAYLQGNKFALRKKIDVTSTMDSYKGATILIYEFLGEINPPKESIEMRMPKMHKTVSIPLKTYPPSGGQ
jgi:hypothetical protein